MPIETICQGCSKKLRVADEHAGKQARCPGCGNIYVVPQPTPSSYSAFTPVSTQTPVAPTAPNFSSSPAAENPFFNPPAKDVQNVGDRWLIKIDDGREFGPVDRPTLDSWFRERRIGPTTRIKRESDSHWQPASTLYPELGGHQTNYAPPGGSTNPFADHPQYASAGPYASPGYQAGATGYRQPHRGGLILAMSIISWFVCLLLGIAAWVMAAEDLKKMRDGRMDNSGYGMTQAGMIIAIIQVVLTVGAVGLMVIAGALGGN